MQSFKQAMAATALVVSLGLVMPSALGGSAAADLQNNPNAFTTELNCDIGSKTVTYEVVSTSAAASFQDLHSSTVFTVIYSTYEGLYTAIDPLDPNDTFPDSGAHGPGYPKGKKKGKLANATVCHSIGTETWTSDGSPGMGIEGHTYYGVIDNTWYVGMSGAGKTAAKAGADHAHKSKRHGKNTRRR